MPSLVTLTASLTTMGPWNYGVLALRGFSCMDFSRTDFTYARMEEEGQGGSAG